jgi:hypothetical protein
LRDLGKTSEAEPFFRRGIAIHDKVLGAGHPLTQSSQSQYAGLLLMTSHAAQALQIGQTALSIHQRVNGSNHPGPGNRPASLQSPQRCNLPPKEFE